MPVPDVPAAGPVSQAQVAVAPKPAGAAGTAGAPEAVQHGAGTTTTTTAAAAPAAQPAAGGANT